MTYWQLQLLFAGEFALLAGANLLGAQRQSTTSFARNSRYLVVLHLVAAALFVCLAIWTGWSDNAASESARQQGVTPHTSMVPSWIVNIAFLLLLVALAYVLVATSLFLRYVRRMRSDGSPNCAN